MIILFIYCTESSSEYILFVSELKSNVKKNFLSISEFLLVVDVIPIEFIPWVPPKKYIIFQFSLSSISCG